MNRSSSLFYKIMFASDITYSVVALVSVQKKESASTRKLSGCEFLVHLLLCRFFL